MRNRVIWDKAWHILLVGVLAFEALGCLLGGILLLIAPDGRLMNIPVAIMHGAFGNFFVPGILLVSLAAINGGAFLASVQKHRFQWLLIFVSLAAMFGWFWIEIAILKQLHWLHAMWGGPVIVGGISALFLYPWSNEGRRRTLLACGIVASLLYAMINVIVPLQWSAYEPASQTVSELSAFNAPTRFLWTTLCAPYTLLMIAFACGVMLSAGNRKALRRAGGMLLAYALLGVIWPFASMHLREVLAAGGGTLSDQVHLALGGVTEMLFLLALFFAAGALGKAFKIYSIVTVATLILFGVLTFIEAPGVAANAPTPLLGVWERTNIGIFLLWVVILALALIFETHRIVIRSNKNSRLPLHDEHAANVMVG